MNARRRVSKQSANCGFSEEAPEHDLALLREAVENVDQRIRRRMNGFMWPSGKGAMSASPPKVVSLIAVVMTDGAFQ